MFLHVFFAWHQPFTNDEGAYLYDARTILERKLPAGDVLTKAPVPIVLFAAAELFTGKSLFAARAVNSIASIATALPLFYLLQLLANKRAAWIGAALWLLGCGTIIFHTIGHTQPIASLFAVTCLWLFIAAFYSPHPCLPAGRLDPLPVRGEGNIWGTSGTTKVFLAGICFALAYMSRKTAIAVTVPILLSWFVMRDVRGGIQKVGTMFLFGASIIAIPWLAIMCSLYGASGFWHALGVGYGDILVHSQSIEPWAGSSDHMFAEAARIGFVYGLLLIATCVSVTKERVLIGAAWVAMLGILYYVWPTHLVEYLADFIPAIVIAGSVSLAGPVAQLHPTDAHAIPRPRGPRFAPPVWQVILILILCINIVSLYSVYLTPWTGMFTRDAVVQTAAWVRENIPIQEEIFTAAVIIPYLSGHHVPFNLSHPQWYRYPFISQRDKDVFLPSYSDIQTVFRTGVLWVLRDQLTDYAYPDIDFEAFGEHMQFPNNTGYRQNPLRVYLKYEH